MHTVIHWYVQDGVGIINIENDSIFVSLAGLDEVLFSLVHEEFASDVFQCNNESANSHIWLLLLENILPMPFKSVGRVQFGELCTLSFLS